MVRSWLIVIAVAMGQLLSACGPAEPAKVPELPGLVKEQEGMQAIGACLEERGWNVEDAATGSVKVPEEQRALFNRDLGECVAEVNGNKPLVPLSREELTDLYNLERGSVECLSGLGYQLEIPSLQSYIDNYYSDPFIAQAEIGPMDPAQFDAITAQCPLAQWRFERHNE